MTSNIGLSEFNSQAALGFEIKDKTEQQKLEEKYERLEEKIKKGLVETFRPEFLNRIDKVVIFKPLNTEAALAIAKLQISELEQRLAGQNFHLKVSPKVIQFLVKNGFSPEEGARALRRIAQEKIESPLASQLLSDKFQTGETIKVKLSKEKIVFEK